MDSEVISIIVPVYNVEKYLNQCLNSITNQTYKNLEIILVDDGSTDTSGSICDEYAKRDARIKVIHKENGGVSSARNVGLNIATGNYIGFVDSDDWIELNMYEFMIKKMQECKVDLVRCSHVKELDGNSIISKEYFNEEGIYDLNTNRKEILSAFINAKLNGYLPLIIVKREYALSIQPLNESVAMREDLIWMFELFCKIKTFYYCATPFYHYNINFNSASKAIENQKRNILQLFIVYDELYKILGQYSFLNELESYLKINLFYILSYYLNKYIYASRDKGFLKELRENKEFENLIYTVGVKHYSLVNKIILFLFQKRQYGLLYTFCMIREFMKKKILGSELWT